MGNLTCYVSWKFSREKVTWDQSEGIIFTSNFNWILFFSYFTHLPCLEYHQSSQSIHWTFSSATRALPRDHSRRHTRCRAEWLRQWSRWCQWQSVGSIVTSLAVPAWPTRWELLPLESRDWNTSRLQTVHTSVLGWYGKRPHLPTTFPVKNTTSLGDNVIITRSANRRAVGLNWFKIVMMMMIMKLWVP